MTESIFFPQRQTLNLRQVTEMAQTTLPDGADGEFLLKGVAPLESAGPNDLAYMDNPAYVAALGATQAGVCLVTPRFAAKVPSKTIAIVTPLAYRVFAQVMGHMFPSAMRPESSFAATGISPGSFVHPSARLEHGVTVDPGAVIGPHAEIGAGTVIGAHTVIGPHVKIGRDCSLSPHVSVSNAFIGNRVILHPGVRIGQDGFGFAMGPQGHLKVPQIGRVIIQDDVEIGANTTVDRGASRDTVIGEGTKIDNLVQIGHNVVIGRHCVIVAQVGIAGSTTLEDYVALGGQVAVRGHVRIGMGAQIAATSGVNGDVPAGARWGGAPAKPMREWFREITALKKLASKGDSDKDDGASS
ncbi:UDP-3-O-(3-hydroxymyristoyl)glucosamine N-acyltransferase [Microvirga sp. ACRRW]|uniref:UDP-3-O-(3-hydroxymyristoyl)glucosamine N-acyltransferase n=1 Tax=Microvirga sp. ACRRW TaxID=2918205 RepID=UPI001EF6FE89|nr:UDP-3-O-(3-hydroxymyristoyl)glucosamine N-acyltransferase [Microvirga sp. ACRRW]MCG7393898.1 UDP-3-O-(3-hydroxymyristoyl)glucosamine N-acyltransferase [Microvirga sp. ACRRW]